MSKQIILREFQSSDRPALEQIIRETWNYDRFCSPKTAGKMAKVYLNSCLVSQTFTQVAELDQTPVGIIMGKDIRKHTCPLSLRLSWLLSLLSLLSAKEGRTISKIFSGVEKIDQELLSRSGKDYPGELSFFAVSSTCRGLGLGRKLFQTVVSYMQSQKIPEFYLFTDTSCNYPFYEHMGMKRRCETKTVLSVPKGVEEMTFFLYEYQIKPEKNR